MDILQVKDANGNWVGIPAIQGPKGDPGVGVPTDGTPGQVVGFNADGNPVSVNGWSNPNILINADFRKNELGLSGWFDSYTVSSVKDGYINVITSELPEHVNKDKLFYQPIKLELGRQYTGTLLANVRATTGDPTFRVAKRGAGIGIPGVEILATGMQLITFNFTWHGISDESLVDIEILIIHGSTLDIDIYAVKLELGDHQTLAHQDADGNWVLNDPPPDKNVESLRCQPMTTTDLSALMYQCAYPTNKLIFDDVGMPGAYVYIPKFRLCDVLSTADTRVHPAFIKNGVEVDGFYMGKFQSHVTGGRAYSLPAQDPSVNMKLDQAVTYNRAKGGKFHEVTAAEWAAIALWCHKRGCEPYGNNNYGKDTRETLYKAVPTSYTSEGGIQRVATGTGPVTWSHDGTLEGIWDLSGNVWEWCTGLRLVDGELQVIPFNAAADPACDLSSTSTTWKAIKAAATSWDDLFITPDGNGTTQGTVKLDWDGTKWVYSTTVAHGENHKNCAFSAVTADASIGDQVKLMLMALAILPDTGLTGEGIAADYDGDYFYVNNSKGERYLFCGGNWSNGTTAGVLSFNLNNTRSLSSGDIGGRSAYQE